MIRLLVTLGDFVVLNTLVYLCLGAFFRYTPAFFMQHNRMVVLTANFAMVVAEYFFPTLVYARRLNFGDILMRVLRLTLTQSVSMFLFLRLVSDGGGFFKFMVIFAGLLFASLLVLRIIERRMIVYQRLQGMNNRSVLFVGNDPANVMLYEELTEETSSGYVVRGYFADSKIENCPEGFKWLGDINKLNKRFEQDDDKVDSPLDVVFCCLSHDETEEITRIMKYCDNHVVHFYYVPRMVGNMRLKLVPERFGDASLFTNRREPLSEFNNRVTKRTFDIVVSGLVCLFLIPLLPIIALLIKIQSRGPVFFKQKRTGLNGHTFNCYKFRSMHVNNDSDSVQATKDDPRKFAFGEFMRKTNIDEFPQFFNVLRGDMSIVGPRPHMIFHTETYGTIIEKYMVRHFCRPGITGWAQVTGFRGETRELWQMEERIKRDIWYLENWTFWLDIKIIFMTLKTIFVPDKHAY